MRKRYFKSWISVKYETCNVNSRQTINGISHKKGNKIGKNLSDDYFGHNCAKDIV